MADRQRPRFHGTSLYVHPDRKFQFRYPTGWHIFNLTDGRNGVLLSPETENPQTWVMAWVEQLTTSVVQDDLDVLREGLDEGLASLDDSKIISSSERVLDNLIQLDRVHSYQEDGDKKMRQLMVVYAGMNQISMVYQGKDAAAYEYWLSMGNYCFMTFDLPDFLFFAADRDLPSKEVQSAFGGKKKLDARKAG